MSLMHVHAEKSFQGLQPTSIENLITNMFDRTFMVFNVFVEDPRACLKLNEQVYRAVDQAGTLSQKAVYSNLVKMVRRIQNKELFLDEVPHENVLCWILKETSDLTYADISGLMGLDHDDVKRTIAGVRGQLLS